MRLLPQADLRSIPCRSFRSGMGILREVSLLRHVAPEKRNEEGWQHEANSLSDSLRQLADQGRTCFWWRGMAGGLGG